VVFPKKKLTEEGEEKKCCLGRKLRPINTLREGRCSVLKTFKSRSLIGFKEKNVDERREKGDRPVPKHKEKEREREEIIEEHNPANSEKRLKTRGVF